MRYSALENTVCSLITHFGKAMAHCNASTNRVADLCVKIFFLILNVLIFSLVLMREQMRRKHYMLTLCQLCRLLSGALPCVLFALMHNIHNNFPLISAWPHNFWSSPFAGISLMIPYFWPHWKGYPKCTVSVGCPAACATASEHYSTQVRSEGHLGELTVQFKWLQR